jgi:cytochrome c5
MKLLSKFFLTVLLLTVASVSWAACPEGTKQTAEECESTLSPATTAKAVVWRSVQESDDTDLYRAYLEKCPNGDFVVLAKAKLKALETASTLSPIVSIEGALSAQQEDATVDGQQVYEAGCVNCHGSGIVGAPQVGNVDVWVDRIAQGMDAMVTRAIEGFLGSKGMMPMKGGNPSLSDEEIWAAVEYMVAQSVKRASSQSMDCTNE